MQGIECLTSSWLIKIHNKIWPVFAKSDHINVLQSQEGVRAKIVRCTAYEFSRRWSKIISPGRSCSVCIERFQSPKIRLRMILKSEWCIAFWGWCEGAQIFSASNLHQAQFCREHKIHRGCNRVPRRFEGRGVYTAHNDLVYALPSWRIRTYSTCRGGIFDSCMMVGASTAFAA
jgi:hypothetical protein